MEDRIAFLETKLVEQDAPKTHSKSLVPISAPALRKMPPNPMDLIAQMMKETMQPMGAGIGGLPGNVGMQITIQQMDQPSNVIDLEDDFLRMMMRLPKKE